MQVRPGYKQTEVGVIPEDWALLKVAELGTVVTGGTPRTDIKAFWNGNIPWVTPTDISECRDMRTSGRTLTRKGLETIRALPRDSVLVTCIASIGKNAILRAEGGCNQQINAVIPSKENSAEFLYYLFEASKQYLLANSGTTATSILSKAAFQELLFALPLFPEQRAIATALSDTDALIASLDKLIAKKRDIKQATMQQLLTGKTRLPGFSGEWEVKRLGDVFAISAGKSKSVYVAAGGRYWIVDMGSVSTDGKLIVSKQTNYFGDFLKLGELVMPKDDIGGGGIIGKVGYIDADEAYVLGDHVYRLSANMGNPLFLTYLINGYRTNAELKKKVIGSAQLGLGRKSVEEQEIVFPSTKEQTAIAAILSDMDAELAALEQQRDKTLALKQGMMQALLTGRIRLV